MVRIKQIPHALMLLRCKKALLRGARQVSATRITWDLTVSPSTGEVICSEPIEMVQYSRPVGDEETGMVTVAPGRYKPLQLTYIIPCAECARKRRKRVFYAKALHETKAAASRGARTWFCTLTCDPAYLYRARMVATVELAAKGKSFELSSKPVQFRALDRVVYRDVQRFLKRLRIGPMEAKTRVGAKFSFMCVPEAVPELRADGTENVNAGQPHYHLLMHELTPLLPIRQRVLKEASWVGGFSDYRLIAPDDAAIGYACKYLSKQTGGRVRTSKNYGKAVIVPNGSSIRNQHPQDGTSQNV